MQATTSSRNVLAAVRLSPKNTPKTGALGGRTAISMPSVFPRVSCNSSFWSALTIGGLKGIFTWIKRKSDYERQSPAVKLDRSRQAISAIRIALKNAIIDPASLTDEFNKNVEKAHWYEVNVDAEINSAFLEMNNSNLEGLKSACQGKSSLTWLVEKVNSRIIAVNDFKTRLKDGIYESAALFSEGNQLNAPAQKEFWREMDERFASIGGCHLESYVADQFSEKFSWKWLQFVEVQLQGIKIKSKSLEQVCIQARKKLAETETVDFKKLTDIELSRLLKLSENVEFKHLAIQCEAEIQRRMPFNTCKLLSLYLENRFLLLGVPSSSNQKNDESLFVGISDEKLDEITVKIIGNLSPEILLAISKKTSSDHRDSWFIQVVKDRLSQPVTAVMSNAVLIQYLKLPKDSITGDARDLIAKEAVIRGKAAFQSGCERLKAGLQQNSYGFMVRVVLDFSDCFEAGADLYKAADAKFDSTEIFRNFWSALGRKPDSYKDAQIVLLRNLYPELIFHNEVKAADWLRRAIYGIPTKEQAKKFSKRDEKLMKTALSHYFPPTGPLTSQPILTQVGIDLGKKLLDLFNTDNLVDKNFRSHKTVDGIEIPVCEQFVLDQRSTDLQFCNNPIFSSHIQSDTDRAYDFVALMRAKAGLNERQIMTASRIASQSAGAAFGKLIANKQLFPLTSSEAEDGQEPDVGIGLIPSGLVRQTRFTTNNDKSLTIHVRVFNEKVGVWSAPSRNPAERNFVAFETDPDQSSCSAEFKFEIDTQGKIQEVIFEKLEFERKALVS